MKPLLLLLVPFTALSAQQPAVPLRLIECGPATNAACLEAKFQMDGAAGRLAGQLDSVTEIRSWVGDLGGTRLLGPHVSFSRSSVPPLRLLVLVDQSRGMVGKGIAFARTALKSLLTTLDPASTRIAVAGFASQAVASEIAARSFLPPRDAVDALDQLPEPDRRSDRALYSAIAAGAARVTRETKAMPGTAGALLVITSGPNEVDRKRDEVGLLQGDEGAGAAAAAVDQGKVRLVLVRLANDTAAADLGSLATQGGDVVTIPLDPNLLDAQLSALARSFRGGRTLTFGVDVANSASLTRTAWTGTAALWLRGHPALSISLAWHPPLFALPSYRGVAAHGVLPLSLGQGLAAEGGTTNLRDLVGLLMVVIVAGLWWFVPRVIWIRETEPKVAGSAFPPPTPSQRTAALGQGGGVGEEVREAPPRRPDEITKQTIRRSAQRR